MGVADAGGASPKGGPSTHGRGAPLDPGASGRECRVDEPRPGAVRPGCRVAGAATLVTVLGAVMVLFAAALVVVARPWPLPQEASAAVPAFLPSTPPSPLTSPSTPPSNPPTPSTAPPTPLTAEVAPPPAPKARSGAGMPVEIAATAPTSPVVPLLGPGAYARSAVVAGRTRTYAVVVTDRSPLAPGRAPALVVLLHGASDSGTGFRAWSGFDTRAATVGAVVLYPDGVDGSWNDGRQGVDSVAHREQVDDVTFLSTAIAATVAETGADAAHVVFGGFSNGAMMAARMACDRGGLVASMVLDAATAGVEYPSWCRPSRPVPTYVIGGTADPVVPPGGGRIVGAGGRARGVALAADTFVRFWSAANGCTALDPAAVTAPGATWPGVLRLAGVGCAAPLEWYQVRGGGHEWFDRADGVRSADLLVALAR